MKIRIDRVDAIQAALNAAQDRARARLTYYVDVINACETVTKRLDITKKAMNKVRFTADPNAQAFSSAYAAIASTPMSTIITCEYSNGYWYLINARRDYCRRPTLKYSVTLTEDAKQAIVARCQHFA